MSLLDAVFKTGGDLSGQRLVALKSYVDALKITFPEAATRQQLALLTQRLGQRSRWSQEAYEAELTEWGARVVDGEDAGAWSWCAPSQAGARSSAAIFFNKKQMNKCIVKIHAVFVTTRRRFLSFARSHPPSL